MKILLPIIVTITLVLSACAMLPDFTRNDDREPALTPEEERIEDEVAAEVWTGEEAIAEDLAEDELIDEELAEEVAEEVLEDGEFSEDNLLEAGFDLMRGEKLWLISCYMPREEVHEIYGEPDSKSEAIFWGADAMYHWDEVYHDELGLTIGYCGETGVTAEARVFSLKADSNFGGETNRGIRIGSLKEDVLKAYSGLISLYDSDDAFIVAGTVYGGVNFGISDSGAVESIFIGAAAE